MQPTAGPQRGAPTSAGDGVALRLAALACAALLLGLVVYLADRAPASALLVPRAVQFGGHPLFGAAGAWLPSFVHVAAFSLLTAAALPRVGPPPYDACAFWCLIDTAFEAGQHPLLAAPLARAVHDGLGDGPLGAALANYFLRGTFDPADIVAGVAGATAAAWVLRLLWRAKETP